jgi:CarD family transcriptional regulator
MAKLKKKVEKKKVTAKSPKKKLVTAKKKLVTAKKKLVTAKKKLVTAKKKLVSTNATPTAKNNNTAAPAKPKKKAVAAKPKATQSPARKKLPIKEPLKPSPTSASAPEPARTGVKVTPKKAEKAKRKPLPFSVSDYVVYPTHGVGKITAIEDREISGIHLEMFVVEFEKDKMTLRVPVGKVYIAGMRKLSTPKIIEDAMTTLKGRARIKRTMWSRRAKEYELKINSGNPSSIAEVLRDLHRNASQPEQSYSERQIYESALDRLVREVAAVDKTDEAAAQDRLLKALQAE